jgi:hypothetical protein
MAKSKVYGFSEEGFRRVREATNRVLGTPQSGTKRRRQPPVITGDGRIYRGRIAADTDVGAFGDVHRITNGAEASEADSVKFELGEVTEDMIAYYTVLAGTDYLSAIAVGPC